MENTNTSEIFYKTFKNPVYVLRTCNSDLTSHGGFQWVSAGYIRCPDWDPKPECGFGLHGSLPWGQGGNYMDWSPDAKWLVCECEADALVYLNNKVKFPECNVVF